VGPTSKEKERGGEGEAPVTQIPGSAPLSVNIQSGPRESLHDCRLDNFTCLYVKEASSFGNAVNSSENIVTFFVFHSIFGLRLVRHMHSVAYYW